MSGIACPIFLQTVGRSEESKTRQTARRPNLRRISRADSLTNSCEGQLSCLCSGHSEFVSNDHSIECSRAVVSVNISSYASRCSSLNTASTSRPSPLRACARPLRMLTRISTLLELSLWDSVLLTSTRCERGFLVFTLGIVP